MGMLAPPTHASFELELPSGVRFDPDDTTITGLDEIATCAAKLFMLIDSCECGWADFKWTSDVQVDVVTWVGDFGVTGLLQKLKDIKGVLAKQLGNLMKSMARLFGLKDLPADAWNRVYNEPCLAERCEKLDCSGTVVVTLEGSFLSLIAIKVTITVPWELRARLFENVPDEPLSLDEYIDRMMDLRGDWSHTQAPGTTNTGS
jgi:hypothetical protein